MQVTGARIVLLGTLAVGWMLGTPASASAGWLVGSAMSVGVQDSPLGTNFTQNVTLARGTTTLDSGEMTLTQTLVTSGPNSQWLLLDFEATNGGLLAGNPSGYFQINQSSQLSEPGNFTGFFNDWSVNGKPTGPISAFGGFTTETNPINASLGLVYGSFFLDPTVRTSIGTYAFVSPYSLIASGGMDPNSVNGFTMGIQITNVPEPSSLTLTAIGSVVAGGAVMSRRRNRLSEGKSAARPQTAEN
jgi:hypothetical protein